MDFRSIVATPENFAGTIVGSHIWHFSGHGTEEGLVLEQDKTVVMTMFTREDIKEKLSSMPTVPMLAFVSACHSEKIGELLIEAGIPHAVVIRRQFTVSAL